MANDILAGFPQQDIERFRKDFVQMIKVGAGIDMSYGKAKEDIDEYITRYTKLAAKFSKKYKDLKISVKKTADHFKTRLLVKEKSVAEFFAHSASKVQGLKGIGKTGYNQADASDVEKFSSVLESAKDKLYISYIDPESGTGTIAAVFDSKQRMVEIIYDPSEIISGNSAGFRICAFYALRSGYDHKIDIHAEASTFGFLDLMDEFERADWERRFYSEFLE